MQCIFPKLVKPWQKALCVSAGIGVTIGGSYLSIRAGSMAIDYGSELAAERSQKQEHIPPAPKPYSKTVGFIDNGFDKIRTITSINNPYIYYGVKTFGSGILSTACIGTTVIYSELTKSIINDAVTFLRSNAECCVIIRKSIPATLGSPFLLLPIVCGLSGIGFLTIFVDNAIELCKVPFK
jgi:hypothetical protein